MTELEPADRDIVCLHGQDLAALVALEDRAWLPGDGNRPLHHDGGLSIDAGFHDDTCAGRPDVPLEANQRFQSLRQTQPIRVRRRLAGEVEECRFSPLHVRRG